MGAFSGAEIGRGEMGADTQAKIIAVRGVGFLLELLQRSKWHYEIPLVT